MMDRISNETGPVPILRILFILSKTLNATFRTTVRFPRKLGPFLPSLFRYGMAVINLQETGVTCRCTGAPAYR